MSMVGFYLKRIKESRGLERMQVLATLRNYVKETPQPELIEAINNITNIQSLRIMIEVGLKPPLMEAVLRRSTELMERRR